jgi:hypothetical protein
MDSKELIAPCGMNCSLCLAFQRTKRHCPGCRGPDEEKLPSCVRCQIKNCDKLSQSESGFCFSCKEYPCERLKHLDKRYRTKYGMSMIENLDNIEKDGIENFLNTQNEKWTCKNCKSLLCVHRDVCQNCGNIKKN